MSFPTSARPGFAPAQQLRRSDCQPVGCAAALDDLDQQPNRLRVTPELPQEPPFVPLVAQQVAARGDVAAHEALIRTAVRDAWQFLLQPGVRIG